MLSLTWYIEQSKPSSKNDIDSDNNVVVIRGLEKARIKEKAVRVNLL